MTEIEKQLQNINENLDVLNNQLVEIRDILKHAHGIQTWKSKP